MPPLTIKRKDPLVKAVRRHAARQLDTAIESLTGRSPADPARTYRELLRLQSMLHLFRRPLGREVFNREHRIVQRSLNRLAPPPKPVLDTLTELAAQTPAIPADDLVAKLASLPNASPKASRRTTPDPKLLRLVADLAELRMRARYWHLPDGDFEWLSPGLRQSYQQAAKLRQPEADPAAFADALRRLGHQLQGVERAWPELLGTTRKALRKVEQAARQQAELVALRPHVQGHTTLLARLDEQLAQHDAATRPCRDQLFVETPAAFTKRLAGVWEAWRA